MSANGGEGDIGASGCCVPESEMLVVRDRNMDYPWKGGNKYSRICPSCGHRQFCAKSYWMQRYHDPEATAHVLRKGDDTEPLPAFECPFEDCTGMLVDFPDECGACNNPIEWEGLDDDDGSGDDTEDEEDTDQ
jgi:hypothetical protein